MKREEMVRFEQSTVQEGGSCGVVLRARSFSASLVGACAVTHGRRRPPESISNIMASQNVRPRGRTTILHPCLRLQGGAPFVFALLLASCSPTAGPDKTLAGGVLGAAWGAGAGAVVGNQTGMSGGAPGVGAGLGAAGGMLTGVGLDIAEGSELEQRRQIDALKVRVGANERNLQLLQSELDGRERQLRSMSAGEAVVFNSGKASLHAGSVAQLERMANAIKSDPHVRRVEVHGHSDDGGSEERNGRLSAARAETVANFLSQNGVPSELIKTVPRGSSQPLLSGASGDGHQLNRRAEVVVIR